MSRSLGTRPSLVSEVCFYLGLLIVLIPGVIYLATRAL